jgi:hypothetical protein
MTNGNGDSPQAQAYRSIIPGVALGGTPQTQTFLIPRHPDRALSIEFVSFLNHAPATIVANDIFTCRVVLGGPQTNVNNVAQVITLAEASWVAVGTTGMLNPTGRSGVNFDGGLRLTPNDDPVYVVLQNTTSGNTLAGTLMAVHGWQIPTLDLGTFPMPRYEAIV